MNPRRLALTVSLIRRLGLVGGPSRPVLLPEPATEADLLLVHDTEYVDAVRRLSEPGAASDPSLAAESVRHGLGTEDTPLVEGMHEKTMRVVGATLTAAKVVMSGRARRAFVPSGGLHHAHRALASGFCVYNDLAIAIRWMQREQGARVLYIDIDAHHGDGVQSIFYEDPEVATVSFHESGLDLFPGTGFVDELGAGAGYGYSINVPLDSQTEDASWWSAFDSLVPEIFATIRPDVVVLQAGCDGHRLDPLSNLRATTGLYERCAERIVQLADEHCEGRVLATGGGGYAVYDVVPRAWTLVWGALCGEPAPDAIPADWLAEASAEARARLPATLRDAEGAFPPSARRDEVERNNARTVQEVRRRVLPLLTGQGLAI